MFNTATLDQIGLKAGIFLGVTNTLPGLIQIVMPFIFSIAGMILLFTIVSSGFQIMTSTGDPKVLQVAKSKITTSLIGILLLLSAIWIVKLIGTFFGIEVFTLLFK